MAKAGGNSGKSLNKPNRPSGTKKLTASGSGPAEDQASIEPTSQNEDEIKPATDEEIVASLGDDDADDDGDDSDEDGDDDEEGTGNGTETAAGAEMTPAPTEDTQDNPERPWEKYGPKDAVILGPDEPVVVEGHMVANNVLLSKPVHRAFLVPNSQVRWSFHLLFSKGSMVPRAQVDTVLVPPQPEENKDESAEGVETK